MHEILVEYNNEGDNIDLPDTFSIMTLNIMGMIKNDKNGKKQKLMEKRIDILIKEIEKQNPDIICFQEMSPQVLNYLYPKIGKSYLYC